MLRVAYLGEQERRSHLGQRIAEPQRKSPAHIHWDLLSTHAGASLRARRRPTCVSVAKGGQAAPGSHEDTPGHNGWFASIVIRNVRSDAKGHNRSNVEHVDQNAQLVVVGNVRAEEVLPELDLLGRVDQAAIVPGGTRGDHEDERHGIELPQVRLPVPDHLCKAWGFGPGHVKLGPDPACANLGHSVLYDILGGVGLEDGDSVSAHH